MKSHEYTKIVFLVLIAGRKQKDALLCELLSQGAQLVNTVYGKGSVKAGYLQNLLGLVPEENKALITCVIPDSRVGQVLKILVEEFHFNKPNTGIAFTISIDRFLV